MTRRILIASVNPWSFCLAVERDIVRSNADATVDMIDMFALCGAHSPHWRARDVAVERINRKFARFVKPLINGRDITSEVRTRPELIPAAPEDVGELRQYRVGASAIGLGILSSVTSITTIHEPISAAEFGPAFPKAWRSAHLSHQVGESVGRTGYDEIHIFNGRHCHSRPFCDQVAAASAAVWVYEQGSTGDKYIQADRPIPHPEVHASLIAAHPFDEAQGESFFRDRFERVPGDPVNFYIARQVQGALPIGLEPDSYVAFFSSSSDEMFAITDEVGFGDFPTQYAAALEIARAARLRGKHLVLRLHPHLSYKHESWRREWDFDQLAAHGVFIIPPEDPCDSYALADSAHCVFTCGSTVGFECSVRGIPNADMGDWVGGRLGAMRAVMSAHDVAQFIESPSLPEGARKAALMYGSFWRTAGKPLPELDVGSHPYSARIGGRIVDPIRFAQSSLSQLLTTPKAGDEASTVGRKVMIDPNLEDRAKKQIP